MNIVYYFNIKCPLISQSEMLTRLVCRDVQRVDSLLNSESILSDWLLYSAV